MKSGNFNSRPVTGLLYLYLYCLNTHVLISLVLVTQKTTVYECTDVWMQGCINVGQQQRCGMKIYLITQKYMKRITSKIIFLLIIINIIDTFFSLRRSVEEYVIYESPQIIMTFQTFSIWIRFDSRLFKFLYKVSFFVIKSYRLVWRIISFVLFLPH